MGYSMTMILCGSPGETISSPLDLHPTISFVEIRPLYWSDSMTKINDISSFTASESMYYSLDFFGNVGLRTIQYIRIHIPLEDLVWNSFPCLHRIMSPIETDHIIVALCQILQSVPRTFCKNNGWNRRIGRIVSTGFEELVEAGRDLKEIW